MKPNFILIVTIVKLNLILGISSDYLIAQAFAEMTTTDSHNERAISTAVHSPLESGSGVKSVKSTPITNDQEVILPPNKASQSPSSLEPTTETADDIERLQQEIKLLKLKNAALSLQNLVQTEQYNKEILELQQEKDKLLLQNELEVEKTRHELTQLLTEKEKLLLENELQAGRQTQLLADLDTLKQQLELENEIHELEQKKTFAQLASKKDRLAMLNALQEEKNRQQELQIQLETTKLNFEMAKIEFEKSKNNLALEELNEKISAREQREIWESQVNQSQSYLKEPFVDGHLVISDRKIELDTVIITGTAEYVNERIHYYNNKSSEYPIFLVIDRCYGGSVMEGSKILEAMYSSRAPVYVVVKTLAASMAAVITALAERSYAYPNAIFVHHQMLSFAFGNQTQIGEQLEVAKEWNKRIMYPVAQKMGITMATFVEKMYENNSSGNWREFANEAVQLKWLDQVVEDIRDTSITKEPTEWAETTEEESNLLKHPFPEQVDVQGRRYVELPQLIPLDFYHLYNPNNYYRF